MDDFYRLKISRMISFTFGQSVSFKLLLLYLIFEYLRPQSMYPAIDVIPWTFCILLLCAIALFVEQRMFKVKNRVNTLLFMFVLVVIISSLLGFSLDMSLLGVKTLAILLLIYFMITNIVDTLEKMFVFVCLFMLLTFKLSQFVFLRWVARGFQYDRFGAAAGIGWLENSGELAIQLCIVFAISTYFTMAVWPHMRNWFKRSILLLIPITTAGGVFACGSRGSFLALGTVLFLMWLGAKRKGVGLVVIIMLVIALPALMSERDIDRTLDMGGKGDSTAAKRLERWQHGLVMLERNPVFGVGYENWGIANKRYFDAGAEECHNIFIECSSELGLAGLFVFIALIIACYKNNTETERIATDGGNPFAANLAKSLNLALAAYLVGGFFVTVFYYPYFWVNLGMSVALNNATKRALAHD